MKRRRATKEKLKIERLPEAEVSATEGSLNAAGKRFALVVSRFNSFITERLFLSAYDGLLRSGARKKDIALVRVPGAFEIPLQPALSPKRRSTTPSSALGVSYAATRLTTTSSSTK